MKEQTVAGGSGVDELEVPVVLGLREGHDGVQEDTAGSMARTASSIASWHGEGEQPEVRRREERSGRRRRRRLAANKKEWRGQGGAARQGGEDGAEREAREPLASPESEKHGGGRAQLR